MTRTLWLALLLAIIAACGGKDRGPAPVTSAAHANPGGAGEGGPGHHEHHREGMMDMDHANLSPEMKAFHDLLAPRWHAEKGPQRVSATCAAIAELATAADGVAKAAPADANADNWTSGAQTLVDAIGSLEAACKASTSASFEPSFAKVHDAFHALMMQSSPAHEHGHQHQHQH